MKKSASRRAFLKAIGGSAAALPFAGVLADSAAQAAGDGAPMKFIGMYHPHGVCAEYWAMQSGDSESSFDITYDECSLQPFDDAATYGRSFKDLILPVEGLELMSHAGGHDSAGAIFTGSRIAGATPENSSIDQYLAVEKGLGSETRVSSAAFAVGHDGTESGLTLSYGPGGAPLPKIIDPVQAFDLLFTGFVVGDDPGAVAAAARQRALGNSVIDFVLEDVNRLRGRVGPREQQKLDQHLTSLRELERQFEEPMLNENCMVPTPPNPDDYPKTRRYNGGEEYFYEITNALVDIMAQAMACDITRFGTLFTNELAHPGNPLGLPHDMHAVAHVYDASPLGANGRPGAGNAGTWVNLARMNHYSYSIVARMMQRLDEFGILDSTLIYASSDMGNPALHSTRNVPTLLAGGACGKFRMGRRLRMIDDCTGSSDWCGPGDDGYNGVPSNRVLVSILQAFGIEENSFGTQPNEADATGTLDGLT